LTHADGIRILTGGLDSFVSSGEKEAVLPLVDEDDFKHGGYRLKGFMLLQTVHPRKLSTRRGEVFFDPEEGGPAPSMKLGDGEYPATCTQLCMSVDFHDVHEQETLSWAKTVPRSPQIRATNLPHTVRDETMVPPHEMIHGVVTQLRMLSHGRWGRLSVQSRLLPQQWHVLRRSLQLFGGVHRDLLPGELLFFMGDV